jgi:hypothetical protein
MRDLQLESERFNDAFWLRMDEGTHAEKFAYDVLDRVPALVWKG